MRSDQMGTEGSNAQCPHPPHSMTSGFASAALPYDLYRHIVENLDDPRDRSTLLSLSVVNKAWCEESQRILYMEFCDDWADDRDKDIVRARHTSFLSAIIDNPARLGPHVRTYAQFSLAHTRNQDSLLGLLIEALPAMFNLQHLHIVPVGAGSMPPDMFIRCTFQLRSLTLLFGLALSGPFLEFLRIQPEIRHLCIAPSAIWPCEADLSQLPEDVCPKLLSTSCLYESMAQVTKGRQVIALEIMLDFDRMERLQLNPYKLDFGGVRYLNLQVLTRGRPSDLVRIVGNDLVLLKLESFDIEVAVNCASLWHLPKLRVLVLIDYYGTSDQSNFQRALIESFSHLPKLKYVVIEHFSTTHKTGNRFSITQRDDNVGVLQLQCEQIHIQSDHIRPWWSYYGNF